MEAFRTLCDFVVVQRSALGFCSGHSSRGDLLVSCSEARSYRCVWRGPKAGGNDSGYCRSNNLLNLVFFCRCSYLPYIFLILRSIRNLSYGRNGITFAAVLTQDRQVIVWTEQVGKFHMCWGRSTPICSGIVITPNSRGLYTHK